MKKSYVVPEVIIHGTVEDITQHSPFHPFKAGKKDKDKDKKCKRNDDCFS